MSDELKKYSRAECLLTILYVASANFRSQRHAHRTKSRVIRTFRIARCAKWSVAHNRYATTIKKIEMKRNRPPDDQEEQLQDARLLKERLDGLFSHCQPEQRQMPLRNRAEWNAERRHAKIEQSVKVTPSDMVKYSSQLGYHYLSWYEAMYCLDSNQLLIYHNDLPLSLAGAYELIIEDEVQLREYRVMQQLTRTGHICLPPSISIDWMKATPQTPVVLDESEVPSSDVVEELFSINSIKLPLSQVLERLQEFGPREASATRRPLVVDYGSSTRVSFDVYKREGFAKNKPHSADNKPGKPDYHLIVCDLTSQAPPDASNLQNMSESLPRQSSEKLMFALVDDDSSIFFVQYHELDSLNCPSSAFIT